MQTNSWLRVTKTQKKHTCIIQQLRTPSGSASTQFAGCTLSRSSVLYWSMGDTPISTRVLIMSASRDTTASRSACLDSSPEVVGKRRDARAVQESCDNNNNQRQPTRASDTMNIPHLHDKSLNSFQAMAEALSTMCDARVRRASKLEGWYLEVNNNCTRGVYQALRLYQTQAVGWMRDWKHQCRASTHSFDRIQRSVRTRGLETT